MSNPPLPPLPTSGFGHLAIPQGVPEPSTTDGVPAALAVGSGVAPLPAVPEVIRSGAELVTGDGRSLPLVSARLHGTAHGGVARLVLEQRFENPHDETLHVTYRMPLPADGAVSGYTFVVADRTIAGRVERTPDARERFERAIAAGHTAALLEQERADVFTQSIANLPANEALIAQITVDVRLAWLPEGEWELRFPTVIGPRYASSQASAADARAARVTTTPDGVPARIHIAIDILDAVTAGCTPSSPSHALAFGDRGRIELRDAVGARLDRDIVVRWPVAGPSIGVSLAVVRPGRDTDCYGLVTIVPPAPTARPGTVRRDLVLVVDISGSMAGAPLDKAKQVLGLVIESLGDDDRFNLIAFSSTLCRYQLAPVPATPGEKQSALRWLRALSARGGTEMEQAVKEVLNMLDPLARAQIVIATDGYVAGDTAILDRLHAQRTGPRLHFLGIGSSVNRGLASAMARAGRGAAVTCDLDEDAERAAKRLIDHTRSPVITDVSLHGAVIAHAPDRLPDVYAAAPVIAAVRLGPGTLVVRGRIGGGDWERRISVRLPDVGDGDPAVLALYAREHVADLEARRFAGEDRDAEIERTGLAFQIATRFTAFVAVDDHRAVAPATRREEVPQELPYGTTAAAFGLRAASSPANAPARWRSRAERAAHAAIAAGNHALAGHAARSRPAPASHAPPSDVPWDAFDDEIFAEPTEVDRPIASDVRRSITLPEPPRLASARIGPRSPTASPVLRPTNLHVTRREILRPIPQAISLSPPPRRSVAEPRREPSVAPAPPPALAEPPSGEVRQPAPAPGERAAPRRNTAPYPVVQRAPAPPADPRGPNAQNGQNAQSTQHAQNVTSSHSRTLRGFTPAAKRRSTSQRSASGAGVGVAMDPRAAARGLAGLPPFSALPDTFGDTVGFAAGSGFAAGDTLDQFGEGTERSASVGFGAQFGFASGARGTRPGTQSEDRPGAARLNAPASPRILLSLLIAVALVMIAALARWVVH